MLLIVCNLRKDSLMSYLEIIKETMDDLIVCSTNFKECKRDAERALSNALSGDYDWDNDKIIETLTGVCDDAAFVMDKCHDEIIEIQDRLDTLIANAEFNEVAQAAIKGV